MRATFLCMIRRDQAVVAEDVVDVKLMQTRVPVRAFEEAVRLASEAGVSHAAWLRGLVLRETRVNGRGKKVK